MKNELITEKNQNIFTKIKNFLYKLFHKNNLANVNDEVNKSELNISDVRKEKFVNDIKSNIDTTQVTQKFKQEEIIKKIEKDDTILEQLSISSLKEIKKFYEKRINDKKEILKQLQSNC